jgi:predicted permease
MNARWRRYLRFFGPNVDADVDDELRFHLESRIAEYQSRGLSRADAERAARERFGDFTAIDAELRDHDRALVRAERRRDLMEDLIQDLRYAFRSLRRAPGFAIVAIATLALGIGANTAVFSVVDAVVLRALPYPQPDRLTSLSGNTLGEYTRLRELNRSWKGIVAYRAASINLSGDGDAERLDGAITTPNLFSVLGIPPALGHGFVGDESDAGKLGVVVLSDGLWRRRFGADPAIVGKSIMVEGAPYRVVGVMPAGFGFPTRDTQLWIPLNMPPARSGLLWGSGGFFMLGRLRDGVTAVQAQAELHALFKQIRFENPIWDPGPKYGDDVRVTELQQRLVGSARTMLFLLLGVVGVVLLIACANVANLLLVRATARTREVAVRMALGGGRGRIVRQFITESLVLAALGGICGVLVAWVGVRELLAALPADIPRLTHIGIDFRVLGFTSLLVVMTGVGFGLLPALRASGDVQPSLRDGSRTSTGSNRRLAALLVSAEVAAAVLLVIGATLLIRSVGALENVDPGFRVSQIVEARLTPPRQRYIDPQTTLAFYDQVLGRLAALPGVQAVGAVDKPSLGRSPVGGLAMRVEGQFEDIKSGNLPFADHYQIVTPHYLETMNVPILSGRGFTDEDRSGAPEVVLVNESVAKKFWPKGDAIGKRIGYPYPSDWMTIVGIVKDTKVDSLAEGPSLTVYRPLAQASALNMAVVLRTTTSSGTLESEIRKAVAGIDPGVPVSEVQTMRAAVDRSAARQRFATLLLALFAGIALVLGIVGIYGVMSYAVAQRQREIGVRMALGASPGDARLMILREGLTMAAAGIVVGLIAAASLSRLLGGLLYGVKPNDPVTFALVPVLLAVVALLASYLPARRATRVDPTTALRAE